MQVNGDARRAIEALADANIGIIQRLACAHLDVVAEEIPDAAVDGAAKPVEAASVGAASAESDFPRSAGLRLSDGRQQAQRCDHDTFPQHNLPPSWSCRLDPWTSISKLLRREDTPQWSIRLGTRPGPL